MTSLLLLLIFSSTANSLTPVASVARNEELADHIQLISPCPITLAFVSCHQQDSERGKPPSNSSFQLRQLIVSLKSIALAERYTRNVLESRNGKRCVEVKLVVSSREFFDYVEAIVQTWDLQFRNFLKLTYVPAVYPQGTLNEIINHELVDTKGTRGAAFVIFSPLGYEWTGNQYRPCATLRLFLDKILHDTDSIIYADTDIVFLKSVQHLWAEFGKFGEETLAAMTPDGSYRRPKIEINGYDPHAYNSGLMLMNLTRMRGIDWSERLGMVSKMFLKEAKYGDQVGGFLPSLPSDFN